MAAAASSKKGKLDWLDKLACQSCGSKLDWTASKVHDLCQTRYCNQECLTRDAASHQLWCRKPIEAGWAEKMLPRLSLNSNVQSLISERDQLTLEAQQDIFITLVGETYTKVATVTNLIRLNSAPAEDAKDAAKIVSFNDLIKRVQHLISRFPLSTHLVVFTVQKLNDEAVLAGQLHLLRLEDLKSKKTTSEEQKDDR